MKYSLPATIFLVFACFLSKGTNSNNASLYPDKITSIKKNFLQLIVKAILSATLAAANTKDVRMQMSRGN